MTVISGLHVQSWSGAAVTLNNNNKDAGNSPNDTNNTNHQTSSKKIREIVSEFSLKLS